VLAERIRALGPDADLAALVALGAAHGLRFSAPDLREAFRHDWAMRRAWCAKRTSSPFPDGR